jgi:hypothetical protein
MCINSLVRKGQKENEENKMKGMKKVVFGERNVENGCCHICKNFKPKYKEISDDEIHIDDIKDDMIAILFSCGSVWFCLSDTKYFAFINPNGEIPTSRFGSKKEAIIDMYEKWACKHTFFVFDNENAFFKWIGAQAK